MKNNHEYYEFLISRDKDNDLDNAEKLELRKHLECCENCRCFNAKINKLSSLVKLEERPIIMAKNIKVHKLSFNYKYIFSAAAAMLVFVGAAIFLNNNSNRKVIEGGDVIAKIETSDNTIITNNTETAILSYDINSKYDDNSAPLAIFFEDYSNTEESSDTYSEPMQTYLSYSLSDSK